MFEIVLELFCSFRFVCLCVCVFVFFMEQIVFFPKYSIEYSEHPGNDVGSDGLHKILAYITYFKKFV